MIKNTKNIKWNPKLVSVLLFLALFLIINLLRFNQVAIFPNNESYLFLNQYESYKDFQVNTTNVFYDAIIELELLFDDFNIAAITILFIVILINILLFEKLSNLIFRSQKTKLTANIFFVVSNITLTSIINFTYIPMIILLILWTSIYVIKNQNKVFIPIIASMFVDPIIAINNLIVAFMLFLLFKTKKLNIIKYSETDKQITHKKYFKLNIIFPILVLVIVNLTKIINFKENIFMNQLNFNWFLIINSSIFNLSIILIGLAIFNLVYNNKNEFLVMIAAVFILISWINIYAALTSMILIILLAAKGFEDIKKRKWFVKQLQTITTLLIILMIMFYGISFIESNLRNIPEKELVSDMNKLSKISNKTFCAQKDCELIEYFGKVETFYSSKEHTNKTYQKYKKNQTLAILNNGNIKVLTDFLQQNKIDTIFLSKETILNTWTKPDEGLLLLLTKSQRFKRMNLSDKSMIYQYNASALKE